MKQLLVLVLVIGMTGAAFSAPVAERTGFSVQGEAACGAGVVELGYIRPMNPNFDIMGSLGYGIGNQYNIMLVDAGLVWKSNPAFYAGLSIDYANYSERVADIVGLPSVIEKGGRVGIGLFAGKNLGRIDVLGGYSTAKGLMVAGKYWF
jgi:hypothetical protein